MITKKMKYVIFGERYAMIFNPIIKHSDVKAGNYIDKPTSAGFVELYISKNDLFIDVKVSGESISLDLKNNGNKDILIIKETINY